MSTLEQAVSLNIAILPIPGLEELAISLSKKVGQNFPTEFMLDQDRFRPHITVYQAHFPIENIPKIKDELKGIMAGFDPFKINLEGFTISHDTFLFWLCIKSAALQSLHECVVQRTNALREGLILPHLSQVTGLTEEDRVDMQNYGSLLIGPRFSPHITMTRLSNPKDENAAINSLRRVNKKAVFEVTELILGYLGSNGTMNGVIETFKLGNK